MRKPRGSGAFLWVNVCMECNRAIDKEVVAVVRVAKDVVRGSRCERRFKYAEQTGRSVRDPQRRQCEFNVSRGIAHLLERTVRMALWVFYYHNENKCYYKVNY